MLRQRPPAGVCLFLIQSTSEFLSLFALFIHFTLFYRFFIPPMYKKTAGSIKQSSSLVYPPIHSNLSCSVLCNLPNTFLRLAGYLVLLLDFCHANIRSSMRSNSFVLSLQCGYISYIRYRNKYILNRWMLPFHRSSLRRALNDMTTALTCSKNHSFEPESWMMTNLSCS